RGIIQLEVLLAKTPKVGDGGSSRSVVPIKTEMLQPSCSTYPAVAHWCFDDPHMQGIYTAIPMGQRIGSGFDCGGRDYTSVGCGNGFLDSSMSKSRKKKNYA